MRIASLLASATEILFALGAGDEVVAVSEKCDFPDAARQRPVVVRARIDNQRSQEEIDEQVNRLRAAGESLYEVDTATLAALRCDLVVTQEVCHVCAASPQDLQSGLRGMSCPPHVIALKPRRLADVWRDVERLGEATGRSVRARQLVAELEARTQVGPTRSAPSMLCLEWLAPPFVAGHWVPDMIECAGAYAVLGVAGQPGFRCEWAHVLVSNPGVIVLMPCGYHLDETERLARTFRWPAGWSKLAAVRYGNVFAVDGSGQFSRHGPRLADGVDTLREIVTATTTGCARGENWRRLATA
ncbi:MAG: ABC transporter substrate-binding protein [Terriglobales bacterium]